MNQLFNPLLKATHHFGIGNTSKSKEVCFVRISKNASSMITNKYKLTYPIDLRKINKMYTFCILREPIERFLSSLPETIFRATMPCLKQYGFSGNVPLDRDIYFELVESSIEPRKYIDTVIDIISRYGFFDAHHAPQSFFLESLPSFAKCNMFTTNSLDSLCAILDQKITFKDKHGFSNVRASKSSRLQKLTNKRYIKYALNPRIIYNSCIKKICFPGNHFIQRLIEQNYTSDQSLVFDEKYNIKVSILNLRLSEFYSDLRKALTNEQMMKIRQLYQIDKAIYEKIR